MVQFPVISSNRVLGTPQNLVLQSLDSKFLYTFKGIYSSSIPAACYFSCHPSGPQIQSKLWGGLVYSTVIRCLPHWNGRIRYAHLELKEYSSVKRSRSQKRMRKFSVQSALNDFGVFLRKNLRRVVLVTSVSAALSYFVLRLLAIPSPKVVAYSDLVTSLQSGSVSKVSFEEGSRRIYFNTKNDTVEESIKEQEIISSDNADDETVVAETSAKTPMMGLGLGLFRRSTKHSAPVPLWQFSARKIDHDESFLLNLMRERGTAYSSAPQSVVMSFRSVFITVITLWVPLMPLMWLLYRQLNASNGLGKKRRPTNQGVRFNEVEGVDSAKVELMEIVLCLQGAINYKKLGAKLPRGVLLVGPPGTGKTLLARAVAGEAGVPFFPVSASEFVELFVGRGAARIRDLFSAARKCAPSIVFIDELDAVGGKRGRSFNDERDQTLNQLLTEMDGFESDTKLIVIAATNRPEALDPALCRPGRFSRKVLVGEPNEEGRRKIVAVHLREIPLEEDTQIICSLVASLTQGLVGADLANIVNEAALLAARRGSEVVSREDVMEAIERAKFGINNDKKQQTQNVISKELGRLFPWMPSLMPRNDNTSDGFSGYQTLS